MTAEPIPPLDDRQYQNTDSAFHHDYFMTMDALDIFRRQSGDSNVASNRNTASPSLSGLVSTLAPTLAIFGAYFLAFLLLRVRERRQYAPRAYLGNLLPAERTPALPESFLGWLPTFNAIPDTYVLQHNSLDGYFLLRYLKISVVISLFGCCITWPILFPVNATGGAGEKQLNILSFSNVRDAKRYYAHAIIAWIFIVFVFLMVTRELLYYINLRQAYLLSPLYASRISSRTVLFTSVPTTYADEGVIRRMFGAKLKNVWIPSSDTKELAELVEERTKAAMKLEAGETKLIKLANDARLKEAKKGGNAHVQPIESSEAGDESGSVAAHFISAKKRPTHRLKPLIGKKVDTINWARHEIERLNPLIDEKQRLHKAGEAAPLHAVFVEFYNQTEAQAAFQMVAHHQPLHMSERFIGFTPDEVVWSNLGITWRTRSIRSIVTIGAVVVTIIFWSIPVALVGSISNITYLTKVAPFLSFINKCPPVILGVITNLLPVVMLAVLMSLLPPYLRLMAKLAGLPTLSSIELRTQESYFWFQVIQVFLVTTMSSAASAAVPQIIQNPTSVTSLLASNLPLASNVYISYIILQGLTFSSGALLQIVGLILTKVLGKILDSTPRKLYNRWSQLSSVGWATTFPVIELLTVISITYSTIAPLMLAFAAIGLYLFYFAFRYNLLFVNSSDIDTKGLVYVKALKHTLVGCYLSVICLIGLFAIKTGSDRAALGPLVLMIILLVVMILYHLNLNTAVDPLLYYLPRSLEAQEEALISQSEDGPLSPSSDNAMGEKNGMVSSPATARTISLGPAPHAKPSMFQKFIRPDIYTDYATLRRLVPADFGDISYDPETERHAYQHPAVVDQPPLLWIPRDVMGISRQEIAHTKMIPMTDEGAFLDDNGKLSWDHQGMDGRPPIYEPKVYY